MLQKLLLSLLLVSASQSVFSAVPCLIRGDLEIDVDGKVTKAPDVLKNCTNGAVVRGSGRIFLENANGQKYSVKLQQGEKLENIVRDQSAKGSFGEFLHVLNSIVKADPSTKEGVKRASSDEGVPGFPSAEIFINDKPLEMNFARVATPLLNFEISDKETNLVIFSAKNISGKFVVPKGVMKAGREYQWIGDRSDSRITRDFRVVDEDTAKDIAKEIALATEDKSLSEEDQRIMKSFIFERYGLIFDRERVVSTLTEQ